MGFNSPEWVIAFVGSILNNQVNTGIYATNAPEAIQYQVDHSEAEVIVVENYELLARFQHEKQPRVKAYVVWDEKKAYTGNNKKVYLWTDFMKLGAEIKDLVIE